MKKFDEIISSHPYILLFDGDCSLCNGTVRFILRLEKRPELSFAALQSDIGKYLTSKYFRPARIPDSIILIQSGQAYIKSEATLKIAGMLRGFYPYFVILRFLPLGWRDVFYNIIARNRKRWFGKSAYCALAAGVDRSRFLDV
jgi:predicted DCC family thiol-disulfide oxidoreductase YuxK